MSFLPIVERELRVAARLPRTYRNRAILGGVVGFVAVSMMGFSMAFPAPAQMGGAMFHTLRSLAVIWCLFEGVRKTADCLSEERREGTLGLLFLTDLKGYDVVLGKLAATSIPSFYGLLVILPILAMPLLVGGVTAGEFWRTALALFSLLLFSLSGGLFVSARNRETSKAMTQTSILILGVFLVPLVVSLFPQCKLVGSFSPASAFFTGSDVSYRAHANDFWISIGASMLMSLALLLQASMAIGKDFDAEEIRAPVAVRRDPGTALPLARPASAPKEFLQINPFMWLAARNLYGRGGLKHISYIWSGVLALCLPFLFIGGAKIFVIWCALAGTVAVNLLVKIRVAGQACRCNAEARRNQALEMLLCAPIKVKQIIDGQLLALERAYKRPLVIMVCAQCVFLLACMLSIREAGFAVTAFVAAPIYFAFCAVDLHAVMWAGMWFGLSAKNEGQAIFRTVVFVLILPLSIIFLSCPGIALFVVWPIVAWAWAKQKLEWEFRKQAGQVGLGGLNPVPARRYDGAIRAASSAVPPPVIGADKN